jgi:MerR family transcriptional regulator, light-induced transcriptional regulator
MGKNIDLNRKLLALKLTLPAIILADQFAIRPDMERSYSEHQKDNFQKDIAWILSFLAESVRAGEPVLFEEFTSWLKTFLTSVRVPMKDVAESIDLLRNRINSACSPEENKMINQIIDKAKTILLSEQMKLSIPAMENDLSRLAQNYLENLLLGNRSQALLLILDEVRAGKPIKDIYMEVFQPVQYEIGRLWQTNKISVAQEHFCTGATQLAMSQLYPYLFTGEKKLRKMVTTCVSGELHEIGARMVTDFFEMHGWDTYYLGANMPVGGIMSFISNIKPQLLAVSATMTFHISAVEEMIKLIRSSPDIDPGLKIIVGGYPFRVAGNLWENLGADGFAVNAMDAVGLADKILASKS